MSLVKKFIAIYNLIEKPVFNHFDSFKEDDSNLYRKIELIELANHHEHILDQIDYENDCEAIFEAVNGKTTDKEKYKLHGRGLNSSARVTTLGFNGEMLIASGTGICLINSEGIQTCKNKYKINGTFIILKIVNKKIDNIYDYSKYEKINKIEGVEKWAN